jgi:serpin B
MKRLSLMLSSVCWALLVSSCGDAAGPGGAAPIENLPRQLTVAEKQLISADNAFAWKLFREISAQEGDENIFVSPLSVAMALGMTYNGAAGSTREAMQQALELQGLTLEEVNQSYRDLIDLLQRLDPAVEFLLANSIWYRNGIALRQEFVDRSTQFFDAEVTALDFSDPSASSTINGWVSDKTNGRITEIAPNPIPWNMIAYLINAIYFKGDWTYQFDPAATASAQFTLADGSQTTVDMMHHGGPLTVATSHGDGYRVLDLPYGGQAFRMTVVLPHTPEDINAVVDRLAEGEWHTAVGSLEDVDRAVYLPKFTLEYKLTLNEVLKSLGMEIAFAPREADFTNMFSGVNDAYIDRVEHKTFLDVNEEGTEAAAVTSVGIGVVSDNSFRVNRPFILVIRERLSGTILFIGKVMDPAA